MGARGELDGHRVPRDQGGASAGVVVMEAGMWISGIGFQVAAGAAVWYLMAGVSELLFGDKKR